MTKKTFEMTWEQVDAIVVAELKEAFEATIDVGKDEGGQYLEPDWELLEAIGKTLSYFMPASEYEIWNRNCALQKLTLNHQLMGEYDT